MGVFDLELQLDRISARLAAELPSHLSAAAVAYARGSATPPAPALSSAEVKSLRAALDESELRARALDLARVVAPTAIEADASVAAARNSERTWANLRVLRAARDTAAQSLFGNAHLALVHGFARAEPNDVGVSVGVSDPVSPPDPAWTAPSGHALSDADIQSLRPALASSTHGALTIQRTSEAHPRLFAIERGIRATIIVPEVISSPATRFAVLHELGHVLLWLSPDARTREWPRAIDEAAAAYVSRAMEQPISVWWEPLAASARHRRTQLAVCLAACETNGTEAGTRPPWALWFDPGAQASYVRAEQIADALPRGLSGSKLVAALGAI